MRSSSSAPGTRPSRCRSAEPPWRHEKCRHEKLLHLLVSNHTKRKLWFLLLAPVCGLALASPITVLAVPELLSRLLSSDSGLWSSNYHYDAPLMPILFIGAVDGLQRVTRIVALYADEERCKSVFRYASAGFACATIAVTLHLDPQLPIGLWSSKHNTGYQANASWNADVRKAIVAVPRGVTVEATNHVAVPLLNRDTVTLTSADPTSNWAVLDLSAYGGGTDPQTVPYVDGLLRGGWRLVTQDGSIVVLHRVDGAVEAVGKKS